jgi:LmbE family N-acetylglucosaminyl deacetylase
MNVIITAHPDDELFGMLGTLDKLKNNVRILFLCNGMLPNDNYTQENQKTRFNNAENSYQNSIKVSTSGFYDTTLFQIPISSIIEQIENFLKPIINLETVFTVNPDLHSDHRIVNEAVKIALRGKKFGKLLEFDIPGFSEVEDNFIPNYYIEINEDNIYSGMELLKTIYPEVTKPYPHPQSIENLKTIRKLYGSKINTSYAEGFKFILGKELL